MRITVPEQIWIDLRPASFASRSLAYAVDFALRWLLVACLVLFYALALNISWVEALRPVFEKLSELDSRAGLITVSIIFFLVALLEFAYPMYFEVFRKGVTPGKWFLGLRVVDTRGLPISARTSFLRTVFVAIDVIGLGLVALLSMLLTQRSQRLGDLAAGTLVVHELGVPESEIATKAAENRIEISLELYRVIQAYLERREGFAAAIRAKTLAAIFTSLERERPELSQSVSEKNLKQVEDKLDHLFPNLVPKREGTYQRKSDISFNWPEVRQELAEVESLFEALQTKSSQYTSEELGNAIDTFQQLCFRYAYLQTFYPDTSEAIQAAKLVRQGRLLIYGKRLSSLEEQRHSFLEGSREGFKAIRWYVLFAAALLFGSGGLAAIFVQLNPSIGWYFINEETAVALREGKLWTEDIRGMSSLASSKIMTNNITVTFIAFALGISGGIFTVLILVFNGSLLGGIFSVLSRYEMDGRLFDFVIAHGVLELSVITVAGGAGLYLGDALVNPGMLKRGQALMERAKLLIDLLWFNALALVVAGLVEGFISPYAEASFWLKLLVGLTIGGAYWIILNPQSLKATKLLKL